ncbi:MAG: type II secretion system F family protein [Candidatus Acidiferrales bacterium]
MIQPPPQPQLRETSFADKQKERVRNSLAAVGSLVSSTPAPVGSKAQLPMVRAGYRSGRALMAMDGLKILMPVAFVGLAFTTGIYHLQPIFVPLLAAIIGYLLPELWLMWRVQARQHRLRLALPDALDMLVICVEAGLGLDQALIRVAHELRITHPQLSEELQLVNMEMRVGKTRLEAMRELARRTGVEDIKALVAMLIQTERFGTSIAQSLRVHSDDLRIKRRQRAEEMSAKTTVKMVPPLVFFIFPALMVVILGPAVITLMRQFLPALNR